MYIFVYVITRDIFQTESVIPYYTPLVLLPLFNWNSVSICIYLIEIVYLFTRVYIDFTIESI